MGDRASALDVGRDMIFDQEEGETPLDPLEAQGLRLTHIATRGQLNAWEQENILAAERIYFRRAQRNILTEPFLLRVHKKMFGKVWKWAGSYRTTEKNIGIPHWEVAVKTRGLCGDALAWIGAGDPADEIAARFHHRLVAIHPFANGNGRHARIIADLLLVNVLGKPRFTWGNADPRMAGDARNRYLSALRAADGRDLGPLLRFVRS